MGLTQVPKVMLDAATQAELTAATSNATTALANAAAAQATASSKLSGDVVQTVHTVVTALVSGTTTLPADDTIPQITEGVEVMTLAITPTNASNTLIIEVSGFCAHSATGARTMALFQDATANALSAVAETGAGADDLINFKLTHKMAAGTTSATTFRVRIGNNGAGTLSFNGRSGSRLFGGVAGSTITITEIKA